MSYLLENNLQKYRKLAGLSMAELVRRCNSCVNMVARNKTVSYGRMLKTEKWQRGNCPLTCIDIARVLGYPFKDVFPSQYRLLKFWMER